MGIVKVRDCKNLHFGAGIHTYLYANYIPNFPLCQYFTPQTRTKEIPKAHRVRPGDSLVVVGLIRFSGFRLCLSADAVP
jgi:hypothetical protein